MKNINEEFLSALDSNMPPDLKAKLTRKLEEMSSYTPKVGVFGKTGVGKSSLCNALFGSDICAISDIEACTRKPQKVLLNIGQGAGGLALLDVPGVGESSERDKEYYELYQSLLPELDIILWVFKGDDRANASDEQFYNRIIRRYVDAGKPFLAIINQVDKIEPFREWNEEQRMPSARQLSNIEAKRQSVAGVLEIAMSKVIPISADERYGLTDLVDSIVHELPNDKKRVVLDKIKAADDAEIQRANAIAAESQAKAEEAKNQAELERIALAREQAEHKDKENQRKHEREMAELKASQEKEQRAADDKARRDKEAADARTKTRNVSLEAEQAADKGWADAIVEFVKDKAPAVLIHVGKKLLSIIPKLKFPW